MTSNKLKQRITTLLITVQALISHQRNKQWYQCHKIKPGIQLSVISMLKQIVEVAFSLLKSRKRMFFALEE
ncbi:unnamed protein product, partial [Wuchereria bancrofti]